MQFQGRSGLITGAGSGIGRATAELFAERGGAVIVADIDLEKAQATAGAITAAGGRAEACRCDVTSGAEVGAAFELGQRTLGGLDVVIHCAGILRSRRIEDSS